MRGRVKNWSHDRGYGFIRGDDGNDYFLHLYSLPETRIRVGGYLEPDPGDVVEFDVADTGRINQEAKHVRYIYVG